MAFRYFRIMWLTCVSAIHTSSHNRRGWRQLATLSLFKDHFHFRFILKTILPLTQSWENDHFKFWIENMSLGDWTDWLKGSIEKRPSPASCLIPFRLVKRPRINSGCLPSPGLDMQAIIERNLRWSLWSKIHLVYLYLTSILWYITDFNSTVLIS